MSGPERITATYTNYKGETLRRSIVPQCILFDATEWHPEPQWLLRAWCEDRQAWRDFALRDFDFTERAKLEARAVVKPLVWKKSERGFRFEETECGSYVIYYRSGGGATLSFGATTDTIAEFAGDNLGKKCRDAAQADYDARTLSALDLTETAEQAESRGFRKGIEAAAAVAAKASERTKRLASGSDMYCRGLREGITETQEEARRAILALKGDTDEQ